MVTRITTKRREATETQSFRGHGRTESIDPAFQRAILKIAIELRKPNAASYETIVQATIQSMRLDEATFRRYLGENGARGMSLLLATARTGAI